MFKHYGHVYFSAEYPVHYLVDPIINETRFLFSALDVCRLLGYEHSYAGMKLVNDEDKYLFDKEVALFLKQKGFVSTDRGGIWLINELGVYQIIFRVRGRSDRLIKIKEWFAYTVLPQLQELLKVPLPEVVELPEFNLDDSDVVTVPAPEMESSEEPVVEEKPIEPEDHFFRDFEDEEDEEPAHSTNSILSMHNKILLAIQVELDRHEKRLRLLESDAVIVEPEPEESQAEMVIHPDYPLTSYMTILGFCLTHKIKLTTMQRKSLGINATTYCKENKIFIDRVADRRYGKVNAYPEAVLKDFLEIK